MKSIGQYAVCVLCVGVMLAGSAQATLVANFSLEETDLSTSSTVANSVTTSGWGDGTGVNVRTPREGIVGNSFMFYGSGTKVNTSGQLSATGDWSLAGWTKVTTGVTGYRTPLFCQYKTGAAGRMYFMGADGAAGFKARLGIFGNAAGTVDLQSSSALNDGEWHYIAATRSGDTFSLYVDGQLEDSMTLAGISLETATNLCIGNLSSTENLTPYGYLDELQVYDNGLSSGDVLAAYNAIPEPATLMLLGIGSLVVFRKK